MTILRRILFVSLFLAGLVALFYAEENWRGQRAWARSRAELVAKGEAVDFYKLIPKRPADSENVMKVPLMESWFIKDRGGSNTLFFTASPGNRRGDRQASAQTKATPEKPHLLGHVRISAERGEDLAKLDREEFYRELVGESLPAPYGGTIYNPPSQPREIELRSEKPVSTEDLARALNHTGIDAVITAEKVSPDRFALYESGRWMAAADYLEWSTASFAKEMDLVREALKRPKVWMDGDYTRAFEIPLQNFVQVRVFAQMLGARVQAFILLNRPEEAFQEVMFAADFVRIMDTQPTTLVSAMIDSALRGLVGAVIERGFAAGIWNDSHCAAFQKKFENVGIVERTRDAMRRGELPALINVVETSAIEKHEKMFRFMPRGWVSLNLVEYARMNQMVSESTKLVDGVISPERVAETARQIELEMQKRIPWTLLTRIGMPASEKAFMVSSKNENIFRQILIASALERQRISTGKYPEELDSKMPRDILTGKPFRYQLRANGEYVLYSPGWDLKDDLARVLRDSSLPVREIFNSSAAKDDLVWRGTPPKPIAEARR